MNDKKKLTTISQYYGAGAVVYLILAIIAIKVMSPATFQVVTSYLTSNALLSQTSTVFAPAVHVLWNIQFRWVVVLLMGLSIIAPTYFVYAISNGEKKINFHKFRFLDWTITGALMLIITLALTGVQDFMTFDVLIGTQALGYALIWLAINKIGSSKKNTDAIYSLGLASMILPWGLILIYALSTLVYGGVRSPWFVYAIYIVQLFSSAIIVYGYTWHKQRDDKKKLISDETYPILVNQIIKVLFVLILIIGLKR